MAFTVKLPAFGSIAKATANTFAASFAKAIAALPVTIIVAVAGFAARGTVEHILAILQFNCHIFRPAEKRKNAPGAFAGLVFAEIPPEYISLPRH